MARVLISMSNDFLNKVDNIASSEQRTRSELIREALRVYIKRNRISNNLKAEENATLLTELLGQSEVKFRKEESPLKKRKTDP